MTPKQVHYEVYSRPAGSGSWALEFATEDEDRAFESAEETRAARRTAAVRVTRESLDPATGRFSSVVLATLDEGSEAPRRASRSAARRPACAEPSELYGDAARATIGRVLSAWLQAQNATVFELLHNPDLAGRLEAAGGELQHALQKVSIPEAKARGVSTHEAYRGFLALFEGALRRLRADALARRWPEVTVQSFAQAAEALKSAQDGAYRLSAGIAQGLATRRDWRSKVDQLLDLAEAAPPGEAGVFANGVLEQALREIAGRQSALQEVLGVGADLGPRLAGMIRLAAPEAVEAAIAQDPGLAEHFQGDEGVARRLAHRLQRPEFRPLAAELGRRVLQELSGPRRLRPSNAEAEVGCLRALAFVLSRAPQDFFRAADVAVALEARSSGLLRGDFIGSYLEGRASVLDEIRALVRLAEEVTGAANKRAAARWIESALTGVKFERDLRASGDPPGVILTVLARLQKSLGKACLAEADERSLAAVVGGVGGKIEAEANLVAQISKSSQAALDRLVPLLAIAAGEAAPEGPASSRGWAEAQKLLRDPAVRSRLSQAPDDLQRVKALVAKAVRTQDKG